MKPELSDAQVDELLEHKEWPDDALQAAYSLGHAAGVAQERERVDLRAGLNKAVVQLMKDEAPLHLRIEAYLKQCAPHVAAREASKLLTEALAAIRAGSET